MNKNVQKVLYNYKNFGPIYGTSFLLTKTLFRKYEYKTRKMAIKILDKKFGYIFKEISQKKYKSYKFEKNLFVFWGQGFDKLPEIPEKCIKNIENMYSDYKIYKITLDNYMEYVDIDKNLIDLFNKGKLSIQTFADILRYNLVYKYGGVWCDATLMFFEKIDFEEKMKKNSHYSLNVNCEEKTKLWGKVYDVTFTTFFFSAKKNNPVFEAINKFYIEYYKCYDFVPDYFLTDYILILAMQYNLENGALSKIEYTEGNPFYLLNKLLNNEKNIDLNLCKQCPQKLAWKNITLDGVDLDG